MRDEAQELIMARFAVDSNHYWWVDLLPDESEPDPDANQRLSIALACLSMESVSLEASQDLEAGAGPEGGCQVI